MNTKSNCEARFMIYREGKSYMAVCLDFNIVQEHRSLQEAILDITNAALCHYEAVVKNDLPDVHLNKKVNSRFLKKWESDSVIKTEKGKFKKSNPTPESYFSLLRFPSGKLLKA